MGRTLPHQPLTPIPYQQMTVEGCLDACGASGYTSAGLEYGQYVSISAVRIDLLLTVLDRECWCANIASWPPSESTVDGECAMPCLGNATEYCGGSNTLLLYSTARPF